MYPLRLLEGRKTHKMEKITAGFIFSLVVVVCLLTFFLNTLDVRKRKMEDICSLDDYLASLISYIQHNGRTELKDELPRACARLQLGFSQVALLKNSLSEFLQNCKQDVFQDNFRKEIKSPIITLFTSNENIKNATVYNWNLLKPEVNLVLFTNSTVLKDYVTERGWTVYPVMHRGIDGLPILRAMFQKVKNNFNTTFYGFVNSDILFTDKFLESIFTICNAFPTYESLLLTGRGTYIPSLTRAETMSYENLSTAAMERGHLDDVTSADYFISNSNFPWDVIPDLVAGKAAHGNWLVAHARCMGVKVIDLTSTILAVDLTLPSWDTLVRQMPKAFPLYDKDFPLNEGTLQDLRKGYVVCPEWRSYFTLCGEIEIAQRTYNPPFCDCL